MTDNATQLALFAAEDNMITVYGQPGCGPCRGVTRQLDKADVPYQYVDLAQHPDQHKRLIDAGCRQTPIIETPAGRFTGNDPDKLNEAIEESRAIEMQQQQQTAELQKQQQAELS